MCTQDEQVWHALHGTREAQDGEDACSLCGYVVCRVCWILDVKAHYCVSCYEAEQQQAEYTYQQEVAYAEWLNDDARRREIEDENERHGPYRRIDS